MLQSIGSQRFGHDLATEQRNLGTGIDRWLKKIGPQKSHSLSPGRKQRVNSRAEIHHQTH